MNARSIALLFTCILVLLIKSGSAAHFIVGQVNNSLDGAPANGHTILLWNPIHGESDNTTDIIGPSGSSGADNTYMLDCELFSVPCQIGDVLNIKVLNEGDDRLSKTVSLIITGADFDIAPQLQLSTPPNVTLISPINNKNISTQVNFTCSAIEADGNITNLALFGNWGSGWHANETKSVSGNQTQTNFSKILSEGIHKWNCLATDELNVKRFSYQNRSLTVDLTPPSFQSIEANSTYSCGTTGKIKINCSVIDLLTSIDTVLVEINNTSSLTNQTTTFDGQNYYAEVTLNSLGIWYFRCIANDSAGNIAFSNQVNVTARSANAELLFNPAKLFFSKSDPIENELVQINATAQNLGCAAASDILFAFYEGDPTAGGIQIGQNQTYSLTSTESKTINISWPAKIGTTNIFAFADINNSISESNETNNKANNTITIVAWQNFYGNTSIEKILAESSLHNLTSWSGDNASGNVFVTDSEANIDWGALQAIGRNKTGGQSQNDFAKIDQILGMSSMADSINKTYSLEGSTPKQTSQFTVRGKTINNVPVINSSVNSNFTTGILWDTSTDTNGAYDTVNKENLVFVTKINKQKSGGFGVYDYEIKIPAKLREYDPINPTEIYFYYDLT